MERSAARGLPGAPTVAPACAPPKSEVAGRRLREPRSAGSSRASGAISGLSASCVRRSRGSVVPTGLQVRCLLQVLGHSSPPNLSPPSRGGGEADRRCREVGQPGGVTRSEAGLGGWQVGLLLQSGALGEPSRRGWHLPSALCRLVGRTFQHKGPTAGPQRRPRTSHGPWGQGAGGRDRVPGPEDRRLTGHLTPRNHPSGLGVLF